MKTCKDDELICVDLFGKEINYASKNFATELERSIEHFQYLFIMAIKCYCKDVLNINITRVVCGQIPAAHTLNMAKPLKALYAGDFKKNLACVVSAMKLAHLYIDISFLMNCLSLNMIMCLSENMTA